MSGIREGIGRPLVSRATAESLGTVAAFVVNAQERRVTAVAMGKGRKRSMVDWSSVVAFGPDAVIVDSAESVRAPAESDRAVEWIGHRLLTTAGFDVGVVSDVDFDGETGALTQIHGDHGDISPERLHGAGSYAIVVDGE